MICCTLVVLCCMLICCVYFSLALCSCHMVGCVRLFTALVQADLWQQDTGERRGVWLRNSMGKCKQSFINGLYSVLGTNYRVLCTKYCMNLNNIMKVCIERCATGEEIIRKCEQVRELCEVRDRCVTSILNKEKSYTIIEFLYTYVFLKKILNVQCKMWIKNY